MTYEEKMSAIQSALKSINDDGYIDIANHGCPDERNELEVIKEALEKQVPKKPYEKYEYMGNIGYGLNPTEYIKGYVCPTCGEWLEEGDHHCPCGQALLWEDTE